MSGTEDRAARLLTFALVAAALTAAAYLAFGGSHVSTEQAERSARRWSDAMGIRITGVTCERSACVVAPEQGSPLRLWCGENTCTLRGAP